MRLAVVSDIHGNLLALEAVLADLRGQAPDIVVNLGDHLSGPLQAGQTADLLMARRDWIHIRGNQDRELTGSDPEVMGLSDRAAYGQLNGDHRVWLRALPPVVSMPGDVLLCHGTPCGDLDYLLEQVSPAGVRLASPAGIRAQLSGTAKAVLCGHSHVPRFVWLGDGVIAANPGSVGLQAYYDSGHRFPHAIENGSPHARYLVLDRSADCWRATFRLVEYDWDEVARLALQGGRADWAHALLTGYALR